MAKLTDMKLPKKSKKELEAKYSITADQPKYPYGLKLSFSNDEFEKIPTLAKLKKGEAVTITARATVTETREVDRQSGKDQSCEIQIEQIAISKVNDGQDSFDEATNKKD
jgi:hypothetical protein